MNSNELRHILASCIPSIYQTGVLACDQLDLITKQKFAVILNTDDSTKPGLHWLSVFKDSATSHEVEFFDSFGLPVQFYDKRIGSFLSKFIYVRTSSMQIQSTFSDVCGQFSVYYLASRVNGITFDSILDSFSAQNLIKNDERVKTFVKQNFLHVKSNIENRSHDDLIDHSFVHQCSKKQIKTFRNK